MEAAERTTKIISFTSSKGGAGRTMALANAAWIMASSGKSVLVIDWDLEAPDLHAYYAAFLPLPDLSVSAGVLDMFSAFAAAARTTGDEIPEDLRALHREHTDFERYQINLEHEFPGGGRLHYMGPGRLDGDYANHLAAFDWAGFSTSHDGMEFLQALRSRMRASGYDYILIDSRTGFSDGVGICTLTLPDAVVIALTMNPQAIQSARKIAERTSNSVRPIALHVVPMRIDPGEQERLEKQRAEARRALDPYLGITGEDALATYWGQVAVPYLPYYAYGEELAALRDDPRNADSLLAAYVRLVDRITDGDVQQFRPASRADVREYRRLLAQHERFQTDQAAESRSVTLLHAPGDQLWADWIGEQLRQIGTRIVQPEEKSTDSLPETDYVLALLSPHLKGTPAGETIARLTTGAPVGGGPGKQHVVGVRVSTARLAPHFELDQQDTVIVAGLNEEAARRALLERFGPAVGAGGTQSSWAVPRFPGRVPSIWNPPMRNGEFTGRVAALDALREGFADFGTDHSPPQVLSGLKGVGKRQIALEYAHRFASQYDIVWWVPAATTESIQDAFTQLAHKLNESSSGRRTSDDRQTLIDDLRQGREAALNRWLIVFDGVESEKTVTDFLPTGGSGHVLITSTCMEWAPEYRQHEVGVFTPDESVALLGHRLPGAGDEELLRLADRVGHLAIAEEQAAALLRTCPQDIDQYIAVLDSGEALSPANALPEYLVFTQVCRLAYEDLQEKSAVGARILDLCAFLSPDGVGMDVIQSNAMLKLLKLTDPELGDNHFALHRHLKMLGDQALAVRDLSSKTLKVHRVVQDLVRGWMPREQSARTRAEVLGILASMVPNDLERHEPRHHGTFAELDKHVVVSEAVQSTAPEVHRWLVSQVYHRWASGAWQAARELGELVVQRWCQDMGPEHLMVLRMESQLGAACRLLGDYPAAFRLTSHAVTTLRRNGCSEADILLANRGYAADLRATGRFEKALEVDQETFSGLTDAIGERSNGTLAASVNLALSRFYVESVSGAVLQELQTLDRRAKVSAEKDHKPWLSYRHLGAYYREKGELEASAKYLTEARTQLCRCVGADSHHALVALASLGMTTVRRGDVQYGLQLLTDAHVSFRNQWGDEHPGTMACRLGIAVGLHAQGRTGDAVEYTKDVLGHYTNVFGDDHPFTSMCRNNLALYLLECQEADQADTHARKAVHQLKETFGRGHRYTLVARMNQNNCLKVLGRHTAVETSTEDEEILTGCRKPSAWGENHPVTLTAMANLLASSHRTGNDLFETLRRRTAEYFPDNHWLAAVLQAEPYQRTGADLEVHSV
ncbi:FxSxx-COOH system tetratricopeptide repeat protein [Streptomyces olivaceus]|uniref:FxSxx-COOH system tetratricopeptide repeat protein n=1 Tax=Streptomyces olivaceus TaxID=47716 RepID=UPI00381D6554